MKTVDFKTNEAAAIDSGAMETDTISKTGEVRKARRVEEIYFNL